MSKLLLSITLGQLRSLKDLGYLSEKGVKELEQLEKFNNEGEENERLD